MTLKAVTKLAILLVALAAMALPLTGTPVSAAQGNTQGKPTTTLTEPEPPVAALQSGVTVVPTDWSLIPSGLQEGDQFRLLFISSAHRNASPSEIATYNTWIQARAANGHTDIQDYSSSFRAVGSTEDMDARDNTGTTYTSSDKGVAIYWLNGNKVADDYEDFYDEDWDEESSMKNESGTAESGVSAWTGSDHDGTEMFQGTPETSRALGNSNNAWVRFGKTDSASHGPLSGSTANRSNSKRIYGLSGVFEVVAASNDDRATLMALYDSAGGANWDDNTNWNTSAALNTWHGVTTDSNGRVTRLYIRLNNLVGQIPDELGDLSELEYLDLRSNYLNGQIPSSLGNLNQLTFLSLHTNQLTGPIPDALGNLKNLEFVRFAGNSLTECVPEGLNYLLTAPDYNNDPAHDFIGVDANGDGDYDDADDTPGLGLLFCGVGELAALELSGVALNPAFTSRRETYTATVPYDVVSTTVTAELNLAEDAFTIKKDGNIYTSGDAVPLIAGSSSPNVITIEVAVADSTITKTYTMVVTRKDRARERVTVPSNWSLIPDGFGPGEQFRLLFVTSEDRDASSSSIADYDAFVRERAAQGHASIRSHSSKFRVVGSTAGFGARGHTSTTDVGVPIYYLNGEKIADNYNDFYDGSWDSVEPRNENGDVLTFVVVWTGTQSDGTCPSYCLGSESTTTGRPELQDGGLDGGTASGRFEDRFYALSPIFMVGGLPQATLKDAFKPPGSDLNGIWSDGTTIWVVDDEFHHETPDTIRAYRKSDQTRDDEKDITGRTMKAAGNVKPRGIWSDGMTMWVADSREDKIFAYDKTTRQRDASKDFYTLQAAGNNEPSGIWSDGMTMWVADPSDNKIYAYRMSDKSRDPDKDFDILSDNHNPRANQFIRADNTRTWLDNTNPHGIWSDGATMWVTNTLIASTNRIYAYRMSDWSRDGARDLILPTHDADASKDNKFPRHIWSDGTDLYVSDGYSDRIFVYSLPRGSSAQQNQALRAPGQPQKLAVNTRGVDELTLNWDPPDSDGGSAITSYTVAYEPDDSSSKSTRRTSRSHIESHESHTDTSPESTQVTTTGTSFTVTGLTGGTEYVFRVIATNDVGDGPPSEEVLGTPLEPPPLEAEFPSSPFSSWTHSGTDDRPQVVVSFSRPVASFTASTPSVSVAGGTLLSGQAHEEQGLENAYLLFLDPAGTDAIQFNLVPNEPCDSGGICAKDGTTLSVVPVTHTILGPATENTPATGAPTISGTARVGETLAASISGIADADGLDNAVFTYLWLADDVGIAGATGSSYTVVDADEEKTIKVRVTFTDDGGNQETLTSEPTAAVAAKENTPATGLPVITGTAQVNKTLTAGTSDIADADGLDDVSFSYQWIRNDADISGSTASTYTLSDADRGGIIKVRVNFTDDEGNDEALTSAATTEVDAAPPPLTAKFLDTPATHDGQTAFTFELRFSEEFDLSYKTLRDHAFTVTGGTVTKSRRLDKPSNLRWVIHVEPTSDADVAVVLPVTTDCDATGAVCTADGRKLSNRNELTVSGPER